MKISLSKFPAAGSEDDDTTAEKKIHGGAGTEVRTGQ
jgi:hypothetical protein